MSGYRSGIWLQNMLGRCSSLDKHWMQGIGHQPISHPIQKNGLIEASTVNMIFQVYAAGTICGWFSQRNCHYGSILSCETRVIAGQLNWMLRPIEGVPYESSKRTRGNHRGVFEQQGFNVSGTGQMDDKDDLTRTCNRIAQVWVRNIWGGDNPTVRLLVCGNCLDTLAIIIRMDHGSNII